MTPERLVLREFGPYTERQAIDFDALSDHHLFLIHGPTGSGKSTLLDAICFALYGETSGDERNGQEMRSDFATDDAPTEVALDFRLGDTRYRVVRRPMQELAKKRGDGFTVKSATATLYDRTDATDRADDGTPLADGVRDVTGRIESLLGLACEQFRQVVMLPQGQFRRFLSANSADREDILKVLFETHRFERLQEILKEMAADAREAVTQIRQQTDAVLERHDVDDADALIEKQEATRQALEAATERRDTLDARLSEAREALATAKDVRRILDERDAARERVRALREKRDAHEERKTRLDEAQRAAEVAPIHDDRDTRQDAKQEADAAVEEAEAAREEAASARAAAEEQLQNEQAREDERAALRKEQARLEDKQATVDDLQAVRRSLAGKTDTLDAVATDLEEATQHLQHLDADKAAAQETLADLQDTARTLPERTQAHNEAAALKEQAETLATKQAALQEAQAATAEAETEVNECESALEEATARLDALRTQRRKAYAAVLADTLTDGDPCPVCGAPTHPDPAHADHAVPGEDDIQEAQQRVDDRRAALREAQRTHADARATEERRAAAVDSLLEAHPELDTLTTDAIQARHDEATAARDEAQAAKDAAADLRDRLQSLDEQHAERADTVETLREQHAAAQDAVSRLESKAETLREQLPEGIDSRDALIERKETVEAQLERREQALAAARTEHQKAREAAVQAQEALENARQNAQEAATALQNAQARFQAALDAHGFESAEAFADARMDRAARTSLREQIETFERDWTAATDRKARLEEKADGLDAPDVDAAAERVDALDDAVDVAQQEVFARRRDRDELDASLDTLNALRDDLAAADARYTTVGLLHETARGDNPSKMSLQRFVLATRLEEVLQMANRHMAQMTQERYSLHRNPDVEDRRRGAGLDLEVADTYTGEKRPVATLSGGEGFQAALALALGLSDVVQRVSGGRHLETLFIDEGFGSLDPEALDRALDALMQLRETGRLVGIISHVADLKQRVPARVEVHPSQEGSSLSVRG